MAEQPSGSILKNSQLDEHVSLGLLPKYSGLPNLRRPHVDGSGRRCFARHVGWVGPPM